MDILLKNAKKVRVYYQLTNFKKCSDPAKLVLPAFICMFDSDKYCCVVLKSAETNDPLRSMSKKYIWHGYKLAVF